ncbi:methyltransferase domain-containing protein [uncultured Paraglaciecola sp.]|uniref:methyltransferase domain-containing protein n=1 Tax=uncultured Paraglaciecola sp. TaxID=1765024 RepID=UPI0030D8F440|tara:strand:- start:48686 stop:49453 length:768 start_codon:yes stop_codon:yes gene_type:complete
MRPALIKNHPSKPELWRDLPLGEELKCLIESEIAEVSRKFFGYHLIRLGNLSSQIELSLCPIKHQINITSKQHSYSNLIASSADLPVSENSVDAFLLAHELDFAKDPHQILREVDRTIMPNGYVVITGFNPFSLCGLFKYLPINKGSVLHDARFFSCGRVKDWLQLLGFEIVDVKSLLFNELFLQRKLMSQSKWSDWCHHYLPLLTSMYIIIARKRVVPLSMIKPNWKAKTKFSAVGASVRNGVMQVEAPWKPEK